MADSQDTRTASSISQNPSRRVFLAAGSAVAVFGALGAAVADEASSADPIFAAIERHRTAEARYCAACGLTDEVAADRQGRTIAAADHAEFDAADSAEREARDALLATAPQTPSGARAAIRYCIDVDGLEQYLSAFLETLLKSPLLAA